MSKNTLKDEQNNPLPVLTRQETQVKLQAILDQALDAPDADYQRMNQLRDWFNQTFASFGYDFYLEDVWNENTEGETHFEYILRSTKTLEETGAFAHDVYLNHQDDKGVWHLDDYQHTVVPNGIVKTILTFMDTNHPPY